MRRLVGLAAIVVLLSIMLVPTIRRYLAQRDEIAALERSIVEQQRQVDQLAQDRARWDDPAYVEQQIRTRLHFVKPGETSYVVLDPRTGQRSEVDAKVVGVDPDARERPWYGQVWGSLQVADTLGADPTATTPSGGPGGGQAPRIINTLPGPTPSETSTRGRRDATPPGATATVRTPAPSPSGGSAATDGPAATDGAPVTGAKGAPPRAAAETAPPSR
nr:septum formation initiator family protein [Arsenicicoccus dermatophilus]